MNRYGVFFEFRNLSTFEIHHQAVEGEDYFPLNEAFEIAKETIINKYNVHPYDLYFIYHSEYMPYEFCKYWIEMSYRELMG